MTTTTSPWQFHPILVQETSQRKHPWKPLKATNFENGENVFWMMIIKHRLTRDVVLLWLGACFKLAVKNNRITST